MPPSPALTPVDAADRASQSRQGDQTEAKRGDAPKSPTRNKATPSGLLQDIPKAVENPARPTVTHRMVPIDQFVEEMRQLHAEGDVDNLLREYAKRRGQVSPELAAKLPQPDPEAPREKILATVSQGIDVFLGELKRALLRSARKGDEAASAEETAGELGTALAGINQELDALRAKVEKRSEAQQKSMDGSSRRAEKRQAAMSTEAGRTQYLEGRQAELLARLGRNQVEERDLDAAVSKRAATIAGQDEEIERLKTALERKQNQTSVDHFAAERAGVAIEGYKKKNPAIKSRANQLEAAIKSGDVVDLKELAPVSEHNANEIAALNRRLAYVKDQDAKNRYVEGVFDSDEDAFNQKRINEGEAWTAESVIELGEMEQEMSRKAADMPAKQHDHRQLVAEVEGLRAQKAELENEDRLEKARKLIRSQVARLAELEPAAGNSGTKGE
jgi:hypothetical protein